TTTPGTCAGDYTITRVFTATDDCGNASSATQTITIIDTTAPVFTGVPADYTAECSDAHPMDAATATDNCGTVTMDVVETTTPGTCAGDYTITRVFTATDDCGNASSATQTITIIDTTAPVFTGVPADYTAECSDAHPMDAATATDNCGAVTIAVVETTTQGTCAGDYTITRVFTATDDCGNASSATQTITIIDTTAPVFTGVPADYTAECSDAHPMDAATASDNCGAVTIAVVETTTPGTCAGDYTITRVFTATDDCGNASSATQTITIVDTTAPVLSIPADYTAECSDAHPMDAATASDNCGAVTIDVVETTTLGTCAGDYTITRVFTTTDDCGNASSATQTITIIDTTAPVLSIPADYTAECSDAHPMDAATATDNCGAVTIDIVETTTPGISSENYTITRVFTATDDCGNSITASQIITIVDTTPPVMTIPVNYTLECGVDMILDDAVAYDNCGSASIVVSTSTITGNCASNYQLVRTFTATDDAGNVATESQVITVEDTTAPIFTYTPAVTLTLTEMNGDVMPDAFVLVWDACDLTPTWTFSDVVINVTGATSTIERTYTAIDDCGNAAIFVQTIFFTSVIEGCVDSLACNYNVDANTDDGTCSYSQFAYDCDGNCLNDINGNGICDELEIAGCTDATNPGYNPAATVDDGSCLLGGCMITYACNYGANVDYQLTGSCEFTSCSGCTDSAACNYDVTYTLDDGNCTYSSYGYDCNGSCVNDTDGDGICDEFEVLGCTDPTNPGYNPNATDNDGSCLVGGCVLPFACNYDPSADYLLIVSCDFSSCVGCMDNTACNYDSSASINSPSSCTYPVNQFVDCNGACNNDTDGDGICDELEILGCTDMSANNYNPNATDDDGSCIVLTGGCVLPFACNYDPAADYYLPGSCDFSCLSGMPMPGAVCVDPLACNFGEAGVCEYFDANGVLCAVFGCMDVAACNYDPAAQVAGSCDYTSCLVYGCTNVNACNFNILANTNDGSCEYSSCLGCTDMTANNFDPTATVDDNSCSYDVYGCMILTACNYNPDATISDGSCDFVSCFGCASPSACNYDANVIYPDGSCVFADAGYDCAGNCLADADGDGVCDANEIIGCTDITATNYNPAATDDSGNCQYPSGGCTDQTACNFDFTAVADNGSCEYISCSGCIAPVACNYDPTAALSDGSCIFPDVNGNCGSVCVSDIDGDGICDANEIPGCSYSNASNYDATATDDDGTCMFLGCTNVDFSNYNAFANNDDSNCSNTPMSADFNGDGLVQLEDLLEFLIAFGQEGPNWTLAWVDTACGVIAIPLVDLIDVTVPGCTYPTAANYDSSATMDAGNCVFPGCTDPMALNFNTLSNLENSSCTYQVCPDFNGDGAVQAQDLLDFLIAWGSVYQ
ncbi:MAG: hypothetical protein COA49_08175, partial [Bacteroidetes bacterium]